MLKVDLENEIERLKHINTNIQKEREKLRVINDSNKGIARKNILLEKKLSDVKLLAETYIQIESEYKQTEDMYRDQVSELIETREIKLMQVISKQCDV